MDTQEEVPPDPEKEEEVPSKETFMRALQKRPAQEKEEEVAILPPSLVLIQEENDVVHCSPFRRALL